MRFISSILICAVVFTSFLTVKAATVPENITDVENSIALLSGIGVISNGDGQDKEITKAELVNLMVKFVNADINSINTDGSQMYDDVDAKSDLAKSIVLLKEKEIINTALKGKFYPDAIAAYEDLAVMTVGALGYGITAKSKGGKVIDYIDIANEKSLFKGVNKTYGDTLTFGDVYVTLANALDAPKLIQTNFGDKVEFSSDKNKTYGTEVFDCYKGEGIITSNHVSALTGESDIKKGSVIIDDTVFNIGKTNADRYLGYNVIYHYIDNDYGDESTIIHFKLHNNDVLKVYSDEIKEYKNNLLKYSADSGKNDEVEVKKTTQIIYNGKAVTKSYSDSIFKPELGDVTFIDNNNDGKYEVADITSYTNVVVQTVDANGLVIYDKYHPLNSLELNPEGKTVEFELTTKDGAAVELNTLTEWDVLCVEESLDKTFYDIKLVKDIVSGTIEEISYEDGNAVMRIDGNKYPIAENYQGINDLKIGTEGTFYMDIGLRIAAVDLEKKKLNYAYLIDVQKSKGLGETLKFKLFTSNGKIVYLESAKYIDIDGVNRLESLEAYQMLEKNAVKQGLVRFGVNDDGNLIKLDTLYSGANEESENSLNKIYTTTSQVRYKNWQKAFATDALITDNTLIFIIPSDKTKNELYFTRKSDFFENDKQYAVSAYALSPNKLESSVLICETSAETTISNQKNLTLISSISRKADEEYGSLLAVTGLYNGKSITMYSENLDILSSNGIEVGDTVKFATDGKGFITGVQLVYDESSSQFKLAISPKTEYYNEGRILFGKVYNKDGNYIQVTNNFSATRENMEIFNSGVFTIYYCDRAGNKVNVSMGKTSNILDYMHYGNDYSKVIVNTNWNDPKVIIIYK